MESSFIQQAESLFDEITNQVIRRLRSVETYVALMRRRTDIQLQYPFVMHVCEGYESIFPSAMEHLAWLEVKRTLDETKQMERMAFMFKGMPIVSRICAKLARCNRLFCILEMMYLVRINA